MTTTTIVSSLAGGALMGLAASLLMLLDGRVAGVGGIVAGLVRPKPGEWGWRAAFVAGLVAAGVLFSLARPSAFVAPARPTWMLIAAGVLVGFSVRLGGGCTSGHGICGLSRLSRRAVAGTFTFMASAVAAVGVLRLLGVQP
jgi:hypothetical protein